jgi:predicted N-acyltransferase
MPVKTWSAHWIAHTGFRAAITRFLEQEARGIDAEANHIKMAGPFKKGG